MSSAGEASHEAGFLEAKGEEWPFIQEERDMKERRHGHNKGAIATVD